MTQKLVGFVLIALCACSNPQPATTPESLADAAFAEWKAKRSQGTLRLEEALTWRKDIERFLGKDKQLVLDRFGAVAYFPLPNESVSPDQLVANADVFDFDSGVYSGTVTKFFRATARDGQSVVVYSLKDGVPELEKILFVSDAVAAQIRIAIQKRVELAARIWN